MHHRKFEILLVEDDSGDVDLTREALKEGKAKVNLSVVEDGVKALEYLRQESPYADGVRPDLILLDLNLPKKDGHEVLREIKSEENLKSIPVAILTTSDAELDILQAYDLGCNCYITKPAEFDQFVKVIDVLEFFWFRFVKLPPRGPR